MIEKCLSILMFAFLMCFLPAPIWADEPWILDVSNLPPEFEASYDIYKYKFRAGKMEVSLKKSGDTVIYQSSATPVGMAKLFLGDHVMTDRSTLQLIGNRYHAIEFIHDMHDRDKNRSEHYHFDWDRNKAMIKHKDREYELDVLPHTFDNYSVQLLLMRAPREGINKNTYSVISKGRLKEYTYALEGNETVDTKMGKFETNKLARRKKNEKETTYFGWYAEKLGYIPVRLDKYEEGKLEVSIQLISIKMGEKLQVE